jgi:hypothetical protein
VSDREEFEAHIKGTAWYQVLSGAVKDDDEGACVFRMAMMAASEAWQAAHATPAEPDADVRNEIIEQCAMVCQRFADSMIGNTDKGAALRSMAYTFADDIRALARNGTEAT